MESRLDPTLKLSNRRVEILRSLAAGRSVQDIGKDLGISVATIYEHIEGMRRHLGASSNPGLIRIAIRHGFISADDY